MSDKLCRFIGLFLLLCSVLLCALPFISLNHTKAYIFPSHHRENVPIQKITTERNGTVSVNFADKEELTALKGIGYTIAELLISERIENGPFFYAEDLVSVKGIGISTLTQFRNMIDLSSEEREA